MGGCLEHMIQEQMLKQQGWFSVKKRRLSQGEGRWDNKFAILTTKWVVTEKIVRLFLEVHNKRMNDNGDKL